MCLRNFKLGVWQFRSPAEWYSCNPGISEAKARGWLEYSLSNTGKTHLKAKQETVIQKHSFWPARSSALSSDSLSTPNFTHTLKPLREKIKSALVCTYWSQVPAGLVPPLQTSLPALPSLSRTLARMLWESYEETPATLGHSDKGFSLEALGGSLKRHSHLYKHLRPVTSQLNPEDFKKQLLNPNSQNSVCSHLLNKTGTCNIVLMEK